MTAGASWVCLMYHDVSAEPAGVTGGSAFFSVSAATFGAQLSALRDAGLRGGSIAHILRDGARGAVAISFDDGDLGQATRAFPALVAHGMTATFFVTTSWVGRPGYASWEQIQEMHAAGMSIQSHSHTHPFLSELEEEPLRDELRRSRDLLSEHLSERPSMLALPGGDAPRASLRRVLAEEGYEVVATSRWGRNPASSPSTPLYVRRCTVRGEPTLAEFSAIARGDRWLSVRKRARESVLAAIRSSLGPTTYAKLRRGVLNAARGRDSAR
ncbi:MAG: polysaccharide deacetylase family protein [Gemmatimonadaceae bacterium]